MATESAGKHAGIRKEGFLMINKTLQHGGGMCIESIEELCTLDPVPTLILLVNDIKAKFNAHCALTAGGVHGAADTTNPVTTAAATTEETAYTLANALKTAYNAHRILTAGSVHAGADATNVVSSANATTLATLVTLAQELRADYEANRVNVTSHHGAADSTNAVAVANYAGYTCTRAKFPAGSWGLGVCTFVKETMATAVNFDVGTAGALTSYVSNQLDTTALASQHLPSGGAILPYTSETALVLTPDVTPTSRSGRVLVQIHFMRLRALTSAPSA